MADLIKYPPRPLDQKPWDIHLEPINDEMWIRFAWFCDLCEDAFGIKQYVLSGVRTTEQQIALRIQNCGPTDYDIWHKPPMSCSPATAIPTTSNHEVKDPRVGGMAIDCGFGYNDVPDSALMKRLANQAGFFYAVRTEDWHLEMLAQASRPPIPDKYLNPSPAPIPPEDDMATYHDELWRDQRTGAVYLTQSVTNPDGSFSWLRQGTWLRDSADVSFFTDSAKLPIRDANPTELAALAVSVEARNLIDPATMQLVQGFRQ